MKATEAYIKSSRIYSIETQSVIYSGVELEWKKFFKGVDSAMPSKCQ